MARRLPCVRHYLLDVPLSARRSWAKASLITPALMSSCDPQPCVAAQAVFYVPQKPYTTTGTLREQVIYPLTVDQAASRADGQSRVRSAAPSLACQLPPVHSKDRSLMQRSGAVQPADGR